MKIILFLGFFVFVFLSKFFFIFLIIFLLFLQNFIALCHIPFLYSLNEFFWGCLIPFFESACWNDSIKMISTLSHPKVLRCFCKLVVQGILRHLFYAHFFFCARDCKCSRCKIFRPHYSQGDKPFHFRNSPSCLFLSDNVFLCLFSLYDFLWGYLLFIIDYLFLFFIFYFILFFLIFNFFYFLFFIFIFFFLS